MTPHPSFEEFCGQLCGLLGVAVPVLRRDDDGLMGFTITASGVDAEVFNLRGDESLVQVRADLGEVPPARDRAVMESLMDANFWLMSEPHGARFSRRPASGEYVLGYTCVLGETRPDELLAALAAFTQIMAALQDDLLPGGDAAPAAGEPAEFV